MLAAIFRRRYLLKSDAFCGCFSFTLVTHPGALESISDANVMPGLYGLQRRAQDLADIIKQGRISAALGSPVALSATGGLNQRTITAQLGTARLAYGEQLTLDLSGEGLTRLAVDAAIVQEALGMDGQPLASRVENNGRIAVDR